MNDNWVLYAFYIPIIVVGLLGTLIIAIKGIIEIYRNRRALNKRKKLRIVK